MQDELTKLQPAYRESKASCELYELDIKNLKASMEQEKKQYQQNVKELEEAKQLLIAQKLEATTAQGELQVQVRVVKEELDHLKADSGRIAEMLRAENVSLQNKLAEEQNRRVALERVKEEEATRFEMQQAVLTENLTTVRGDLMTALQKVEDLTRVSEELKGGKLELEAKLENSNDERRLLVERCISSEGDCEKLREKVTEHRRKLDDAQSALQELGRENQSLQITTTKVKTRQWKSDDDVKECETCQKAFSVTIRKHHCRNCGHIFCNECSSKQAQVASSKKPVRVCDGCYTEVSHHR